MPAYVLFPAGAVSRLPEPVKATPFTVPATLVPVWFCHTPVAVTRPLPVRVDMRSNEAVEPMAVEFTCSWVPPLIVVKLTPVMPAAVMALLRLPAIDVSCSLTAVVYDAVTPPTRMLMVSAGFSLPPAWTVPVMVAADGARVMLTAQLAAVIDGFD